MRAFLSRACIASWVVAIVGGPSGSADARAEAEVAPPSSVDLRAAVTVDGIFEHLRAFQQIADRNGGVRSAGSLGDERSVDYAAEVFTRAGYRVTRQSFAFPGFLVNSPSALRRIAPEPEAELSHNIMTYSGSGDVTRSASVPVGSALGCAPSDFDGSNADTVVLVSRGTCGFGQKATNAFQAGAAALVIYNNQPGFLQGTLSSPTDTFSLDIAVVGVTQALGRELIAAVPEGLVLEILTDTTRQPSTTTNLLAESIDGDPEDVVMAGAHLDSVAVGPGINDNGTGAAALLEIAEQMSQVAPTHRLRFALWGAEELGLLGSNHYVGALSAAERQQIALYLNFDMLGSPNYVRFVLDGDNSSFPAGGGVSQAPAGSAAIEQLFNDYFAEQGLPTDPTPFNGRSDYAAFIAPGVDIPSGGLISGSDGIKTDSQASVYGGIAGAPYDGCYHQSCDTLANVDRQALGELSGAVAHALQVYAFDTSSVRAGRRAASVAPLDGAAPFAHGDEQ